MAVNTIDKLQILLFVSGNTIIDLHVGPYIENGERALET